jgi:L-cystine uptake protein TcyP (sodium:dicarboxylate symporter family)
MRWVVKPVEEGFLLAMVILIVPLLVSAIVSGIARLRDMAGMGRLLLSTLAYMLAASLAAAMIGLAMVDLFRPGDVVPAEIGQQLLAAGRPAPTYGWVQAVLAHTVLSHAGFPRLIERPILPLIVVSVVAGLALTVVRTRRSGQVLATSERVFDAGMRILVQVGRMAPLAVACFMFDLTLLFGWHLLLYLSAYVAVVIAALLLQVVLTFFAVVWMRGGVMPLAFLRGVQEPAVIAFCTSSSNLTLPSALRAAEHDLHLPRAWRDWCWGWGRSPTRAGRRSILPSRCCSSRSSSGWIWRSASRGWCWPWRCWRAWAPSGFRRVLAHGGGGSRADRVAGRRDRAGDRGRPAARHGPHGGQRDGRSGHRHGGLARGAGAGERGRGPRSR